MTEPLAARVREEGGLALPSDLRVEWLELLRARPALFRRNGLPPDIMAAALGVDSDTDLHDRLTEEILSARRRAEGAADLHGDSDQAIAAAYAAHGFAETARHFEEPADPSRGPIVGPKRGPWRWPGGAEPRRAAAPPAYQPALPLPDPPMKLGRTIKAITLTQPWASLVEMKRKRFETRSWQTTYRGPLAIHAAKGFPAECRQLVGREPFRAALGRRSAEGLPRGAVIAIARLVACHRIGATVPPEVRECEVPFGNYSPGRFAWELRDVVSVGPSPTCGKLMLWDWTVPDAYISNA